MRRNQKFLEFQIIILEDLYDVLAFVPKAISMYSNAIIHQDLVISSQ